LNGYRNKNPQVQVQSEEKQRKDRKEKKKIDTREEEDLGQISRLHLLQWGHDAENKHQR